MSNVGKPLVTGGPKGTAGAVLRAKYLDFCSARVAEVLLSLSPDEMYLLAADAARDAGHPDSEPLGYDAIVRLATERISNRLDLPTVEDFIEAYRRDPDAFDREMLGLWESEI